MRNNDNDNSFGSALKIAAERDKLRLHTPGHKGKLCDLDLTELTDDSFPSAALSRAEKNAAEVYGAKHMRFLCGGSSQGVKSAVYFAQSAAIVDINSHRAVFDGFKLSGKTCITVGERGSVFPITLDHIRKALTHDVTAIVVTSPTYYGYVADIYAIRDFCRRYGLLFIADSAHGAHFGFSEYFPSSAATVADICNLSTHKTLSALTQTALLADNLDDGKSARLGEAVDIMGTTSPSYLLYASIDHAVRKAASDDAAAAYDELYTAVADITKRYPFLQNDDFTRLVLDCETLGISSAKLNASLCAQGVYPELVDDKRIVFILTAENTQSDVLALDAALFGSVKELR